MIPTDKIRDLIGKGGATIRGIVEQTGAKIDVDDTGKVSVASSDAEGLKKALAMISDLTAVPEIGKVYLGKVVRLAEFGAFVELFPGTDGLLHISEIAEHRVKEVKDELREGDQVMVKVLALEGNRIKLSRKALIKEQKAKLAQQGGAEPERSGDAGSAEKVLTARGSASASSQRVRRAPTQIESEHDSDRGWRGVRRREREEFDEGSEPNFNRVEGAPVPARSQSAGGRPPANNNNRRRRRRRPTAPAVGAVPATGRPGIKSVVSPTWQRWILIRALFLDTPSF